MEELMGIMVALAAILGIFVVIPLVVFLIVRKILSDRHRERMAMIEHGLDPKFRQKAASPAGAPQQEETGNPAANAGNECPLPPNREWETARPYDPAPRAEDSTVKWMYVFGGGAAGLLVASVVTNLLFTYTLIETKGLGLSIVVLSVCIALYIYYVRKNRKARKTDFRPGRKDDAQAGKGTYTEE